MSFGDGMNLMILLYKVDRIPTERRHTLIQKYRFQDLTSGF